MIFFYFQNINFLEEEYNFCWKSRDVNYWMVVLIFVLYLMILIVEFGYKLSLNLMYLSLFYIILLRDFLFFFLFYEMIFVLIIFSIILLGYRFERLIAAFLMLFYSFIFSSPVLIIILLFDWRFLIKEWVVYDGFIIFFLIGSFVVKFPVFGFHYWLPIAHVEASTIGSMVLAGILLKVGCVGLIYVVIYLKFMIKWHWIRIRIVLLILIILSIRDLKIIIAYSSVAHIRMVFYVLIIGYRVRKKGALIIMFYHGYISPLMFWVVGVLAWWKTRSLLVVKMISFSYIFVLCLFLLFVLNIGFPPFIGFLREIYMIKVFVLNKIILFVLILRILFRCYYNVYLFWCFNGFIGIVFKMNFFSLDLFIFLGLRIILNFY
jgi:NADH:ubiquinone oxidoreductase subunit 4 (subunit M)